MTTEKFDNIIEKIVSIDLKPFEVFIWEQHNRLLFFIFQELILTPEMCFFKVQDYVVCRLSYASVREFWSPPGVTTLLSFLSQIFSLLLMMPSLTLPFLRRSVI